MISHVGKFLVLWMIASHQSLHGAPQRDDDPTTVEDYQGYVRAQEIFKEAFDFSTEEMKIATPVLNPKWDYRWANVSWVMGLRGRDEWGKWYRAAECNGMMVQPRVAVVPCSCIWSWYLSFGGSGNFTPAADRTDQDLTTPELFLFHTYHQPSDADVEGHKPDYFRDEITRYYAVINDPLESYECAEAIGNPPKQLDGVALLEVETPVYEGDDEPVGVPLYYDGNDYTKVAEDSRWDWPLKILSYGIRFVNPNVLYVPDYALPDYKKKHERWRAWSNYNRLRNELVYTRIRPRYQGCRQDYLWHDEYKYEKECWRAGDMEKELCDILPGSPIMTRQNKLYGMVLNRVQCPSVGKDTYFEVHRFSEYKVDVIRNLLKVFEERIRIPLLAYKDHDKSQILFNKTLGRIFYDEDIDPGILYKIKNNISFDPGPLGNKRKRSGVHPLHVPLALVIFVIISHLSFDQII